MPAEPRPNELPLMLAISKIPMMRAITPNTVTAILKPFGNSSLNLMAVSTIIAKKIAKLIQPSPLAPLTLSDTPRNETVAHGKKVAMAPIAAATMIIMFLIESFLSIEIKSLFKLIS